MSKASEHIFQFKITLQEIKPPIWRRVLVPEDMAFGKFSNAILKFMGWQSYHLHSFYVKDPKTGVRMEITDQETWEAYDENDVSFDEKKFKLNQIFSVKNKKAEFVYDFGDDWRHEVLLEKIIPKEAGVKYPVCIDGKRACPPEDVGGISGYEEFLEAIKDPEHPEHDEWLTWVGGNFDPERCNAKLIKSVKSKEAKAPKLQIVKEDVNTQTTRESVGINPEIALIMVVKLLPALPFDFEEMLSLSEDWAEMVRSKPGKKLKESILLELLVFDLFTFRITTVKLVEDYPNEFRYLERAARMVMIDQMAGFSEDLLDKLRIVDGRLTEYWMLGEKQPNPEIIFNGVISKMAGYIALGKPSEELKRSIESWAYHYVSLHIELFQGMQTGIESAMKLLKKESVTLDLIEEMRRHLPIPVDARPELLKTLKKQGASLRQMNALKITDVQDSGDMGGIVCGVTGMDKKPFYASLTHLRMRDGHPLKDRVVKYQKERVNHLMREDKKSGVKGSGSKDTKSTIKRK